MTEPITTAVGVDVGVGMDVGNLVTECVDGHDLTVSTATGEAPVPFDGTSGADPGRFAPHVRRIEIELTSARPDGTWTWRAAGAREPKGVLDGAVLPEVPPWAMWLRAEAEADLDGLSILSVTPPKGKVAKSVSSRSCRATSPSRPSPSNWRSGTATTAAIAVVRAATATTVRAATVPAASVRAARAPVASAATVRRAVRVASAVSAVPAPASRRRPSCRSAPRRSV